jgi:2-iminobutanoate/2-iminopropanoate deaminase
MSKRSPFFAAPMIALAAALALPACATTQQAPNVEYFGVSGPNSTLASAVIVDNIIYLSGVLPAGGATTIQEQTQSVMERIRTNLAEHGAVMDDIIKCTVFMADLSQRPALNEVYRSFFTDNRPARSAVGVDLGGPGVEIECMALLRNR